MILRNTLIAALIVLSVNQIAFAQISISPQLSEQRNFEFEVPAGQEVNGILKIRNLLETPTTAKIYTVDATVVKDGSLSFTTNKTLQKTIGVWGEVPINQVEIGGRQNKEVAFKIKVPANTPPGTYIGGIAAEEISSPSLGEEKSQVEISSRVINKIYIKVPGTITHRYKWLSLKLNKNPIPEIKISVENSGNSLLTISGENTITNLITGETANLKTDPLSLFAGETKETSTRFKNAPQIGIFNVKSTLAFGKYDFLSRKSLDQKYETKEITIILIPDYLKIAVVVFFILILIYFTITKIIRRNLKKTAAKYKVKRGDTLTKIADKHDINWKDLAKFNKIKAPYVINDNDTLLIPNKK